MISSILTTFERGLKVMRLNSRLLLVGILVFVFPLLFVWITQSFFSTAYSNIDTTQKQRVAMLHDSMRVVLQESQDFSAIVPTLINEYLSENQDISKVRVIELTGEEFVIQHSFNPEEVGTSVISDELFKNLPLSTANGTVIYPTKIAGVRTWQAFSKVETSDNSYIVFSEHNFNLIDSVMLARQQQSYLGLTAIFLFLIGLAYWINKQIQWEKRSDKLTQQLHERDLFSNMIAHEFRAPLTAIKGYASFLEESQSLKSEEKRFANNIRISAERLVLLVSDFLEVARLQSGKLEIKKEKIDVREVLTKVTEDLHITAKNKDLKLVYQEPVQPIWLVSDSGRLTQVMTNLVSNSIKYTESGAIEIECQKEVKKLVIRIKDTGMGISAADQKKLFAPFVRVGGVDQTVTTGTGLGMWITKQLVELLGGEIGVESIKGVGTHVVVTFYE
jgi:signal transduction histidine kinase